MRGFSIMREFYIDWFFTGNTALSASTIYVAEQNNDVAITI